MPVHAVPGTQKETKRSPSLVVSPRTWHGVPFTDAAGTGPATPGPVARPMRSSHDQRLSGMGPRFKENTTVLPLAGRGPWYLSPGAVMSRYVMPTHRGSFNKVSSEAMARSVF